MRTLQANKAKELYNTQAEEALAACALFERDLLALDVQPSDFHDTELARIWGLAQELQEAGQDVDPIILHDEVVTRGLAVNPTRLILLQALEGLDYTHGGQYANIVLDYARRRRVEAAAQDLVRVAHTSNGSLRDDVAQIAGDLARLTAPPTPAKPQRQTSWTAAELLAAEFAEPQWAVPGIIPTGLTFLAGRPKVGKSWLALQIAIAVSTGGMVLDRRVPTGRVLYLALEDNARRLQERAGKQMMPASAALRFETTWRRFTEGGLDDLYTAILDDGITLAIVDTLGRVLGRADQSDLADMTELVGGLQEFAVTRDIAVLVIDHHRKPAGYDGNPIDDIVGSTAKSAVADAALGLFTTQGKRGATLKVTGRDVEWQDLALGWDALSCCWQYEGTTEEIELQGRRGDVLAVLQEHFPESMIAPDIARLVDMRREKVSLTLNDLVTRGQATREPKRGKEQPYRATVGNGGV